MDILYAVHLLLFLAILSIPFLPKYCLKYAVYVPMLLSFSWVAFEGCIITNHQTNLKNKTFTQDLYNHFIPNISVLQSEHINTAAFTLITVIGFHRLCKLYK